MLVDAAVAVAGDAVPGHSRSHTVQLDPVAVVGMPVLAVARDRVVLVDVPERARELTDTGHPVSRDRRVGHGETACPHLDPVGAVAAHCQPSERGTARVVDVDALSCRPCDGKPLERDPTDPDHFQADGVACGIDGDASKRSEKANRSGGRSGRNRSHRAAVTTGHHLHGIARACAACRGPERAPRRRLAHLSPRQVLGAGRIRLVHPELARSRGTRRGRKQSARGQAEAHDDQAGRGPRRAATPSKLHFPSPRLPHVILGLASTDRGRAWRRRPCDGPQVVTISNWPQSRALLLAEGSAAWEPAPGFQSARGGLDSSPGLRLTAALHLPSHLSLGRGGRRCQESHGSCRLGTKARMIKQPAHPTKHPGTARSEHCGPTAAHDSLPRKERLCPRLVGFASASSPLAVC